MGAIAIPESNQPTNPTVVSIAPMPSARSTISWRLGLDTSNQG